MCSGGLLFSSSGFAHADNSDSIDLERSSGQYVYISDGAQTGLDITGDLTIEAWVKLETQLATDETYVIVSKDGYPNARGYDFKYFDTSGTKALLLQVSDNGTSVTNGNVNQTLSVGDWHHVVAVYDASAGSVEFYVDGASIGSASSLPTSIANNNNEFAIGAEIQEDGTPTSSTFDGKIDDVRVWNILRTSQEIQDNYQKELMGTESNLVGYWKFNSDLNDTTSNNNDLTNVGSAAFASDVPFVNPPTISYLNANPDSMISGQSSVLSWSVSGSTAVSINNGVGSVSASSTTSVSPSMTTTYTLTASNQGQATSTEMVTVVVGTATTTARKTADESVTNSTTLQNDNDLSMQVDAGKTYVVEGILFASSTSATPDIKIAFTTPSGSDVAIGYLSNGGSSDGGMLQAANVASERMQIPSNTAVPIIIRGTIVAGASGTLQLQWAQFALNANAVVLKRGSYLKIEEI
jgi:hypothetical protein